MLLYTTLRTVYCTSKANADSQIHPKISVCQKSTQKNPASLIRCQIFLQRQSAGKTRTSSHHSYCLNSTMDAPHWQDFGHSTWQTAVGAERRSTTLLWTTKIWPCDTTASWVALVASARTHHLPTGDTCVSLSTQHVNTISPSSYIGRVASPLVNDCARHHRQTSSFRVLHARQSAIVHFAWLQLGRGIPWHRPCSLLSHLQFFDVDWRLKCSCAPSQINYISECSMLHDSVYFTSLKSLDYNVVMTF